jgi:transcriptional regulator with XRE-family HTH domain
MTYFGKNLKALVSKLGITQASIEGVVEKRQTTISNWVNGRTNPDAEDLVKLSEFFGLPIDDLCLTDLSHGNLITQDYISNFRAKGSLKGKPFGSLTAENNQFIAMKPIQNNDAREDDNPLLWSVLKLMQGIDQKLDEIRADIKAGQLRKS